MYSSLVTFINHVLDQNSWAQTRLAPFRGQVFSLSLGPFPQLLFRIDEGSQLAAAPDAVPDVHISLSTEALTQLPFASERLLSSAKIEGSAEFGEALGFVFRHIKWDLEEDLSTIVGEVGAVRLVTALDFMKSWASDSHSRFSHSLVDFLTLESGALVPPLAASLFYDDVDQVRNDLSRLEKRVRALENALS